MKYLEIIEKLHPDIIHHFLSTGECQGIPVEVQRFLKQMQWAAEIYEYERNITRAAGMLRNRIKAQQGSMWMCAPVRAVFIRRSTISP